MDGESVRMIYAVIAGVVLCVGAIILDDWRIRRRYRRIALERLRGKR